ncbi:MFS transporter [Candidatus Methylobacter oryzae]|uniref:MFS transporter n=1 Tax=Candidatus Methylobacter oryzae TaxID=2497749 RepID=A0ABY3CF52_9GAMM|nr:MFS transporter [Candidatus Methylobacter oryzae]TRX01961.1 MFS transporter [Candidatus Methylobacter oryzae]
MNSDQNSQTIGRANRKELLAWALYDFANSGYTTVVQTTIFSAYFVGVVAGAEQGIAPGLSTLLWSLAIGIANFIVMISGPLIGAVADHRACKKLFLLISSIGCIFSTALLALAGPGDIGLAMVLVTFSAIMFASGENLIAAFLPEIVPEESMGKMSGYGWSLGYFGGLLTLGICLAYITWAKQHGLSATHFVPVTLLITAAIFALAAAPTFLWLRERATPSALNESLSNLQISYARLAHTFKEAARFRDLLRFLITLGVYQSGVSTVVVLSAVYAQEVMGFDTQSLIVLVMVVNVTAAIGAFICGHLQDRIGSVPSLAITLIIWIIAVIAALLADKPALMWLAGNMIGLAMGASQSVGRALVGKFSPTERAGEFLGLWGLVNRLSAIVGPLSYGLINYWSNGNHRLSLLSTLSFFIIGLFLLFQVNERRGKAAAMLNNEG